MTRDEMRIDAIAAMARRGEARPEDVLYLLSLLSRAREPSSSVGSVLSAPERGGSIVRISVEIESAEAIDAHDSPSGLPVRAVVYGPHPLGRLLPGPAVLEVKK